MHWILFCPCFFVLFLFFVIFFGFFLSMYFVHRQRKQNFIPKSSKDIRFGVTLFKSSTESYSWLNWVDLLNSCAIGSLPQHKYSKQLWQIICRTFFIFRMVRKEKTNLQQNLKASDQSIIQRQFAHCLQNTLQYMLYVIQC